MVDLLDANVWLSLSVPDHVHHRRALRYWREQAAARLAFCRLTALALLRLLTNRHVMGARAQSGGEAWRGLETWLATPGIEWMSEPQAVDEFLRAWAAPLDLRAARWTDAYLAAFAVAGNCRLVSFDRDLCRFAGVDFLHLQA